MSLLGIVLLGLAAVLTPVTGLPAFAVLLAMAVLGAILGVTTGSTDLSLFTALPSRIASLFESDLLQALPLYVLMGALLNRLPIAEALFRSTIRLMRGSPAAPALSAIGLGVMIAPMNGSVGACVVALSRSATPRLAADGMPAPARQALIAVSSTLGLVVPPSLVLIFLGDAMMTAHTIALHINGRADRIVNTQDIFRAALVPGGLFVLACMAVSFVFTRKSPAPPRAPSASALRDALIASATLAFVGTLLVGVSAGYFYAVEGAAGGTCVLFIVAACAGRLSGNALRALLMETMATTGALFALLAAATTFTLVFRALGTDRLIDSWIGALPGGASVATLTILGAIALCALALDAFEIIFVIVPVLMPPLLARVPDVSWVAVLVLLTLQTSFLLPPIGYALLMVRTVQRERVSVRAVVKHLTPYLVAQVALFICIFAFPSLVHLGQSGWNAAAPASLPPMSDDMATQKMREMIAPPTESPDDPAAQGK